MKRKNKFKTDKKIFKLPAGKYFIINFRIFCRFILFFLASLLLFFIFKSDFFKIKFIQCSKDGNLCANNELDFFNILYDQNIFLINKKELTREFKFKNITVKEINIKTGLPNKVVIYLKNRKPLVLLKTDKNEFLVDETGFIFEEVRQKNHVLPVIILKNQTASLGMEGDEKIIKLIQLSKNLQELFIPFNDLVFEDKDYIVCRAANFLAIFSQDKDFFTQAVSLQMILQSSKIKQGEDIKIDLRFDKPVVSFND